MCGGVWPQTKELATFRNTLFRFGSGSACRSARSGPGAVSAGRDGSVDARYGCEASSSASGLPSRRPATPIAHWLSVPDPPIRRCPSTVGAVPSSRRPTRRAGAGALGCRSLPCNRTRRTSRAAGCTESTPHPEARQTDDGGQASQPAVSVHHVAEVAASGRTCPVSSRIRSKGNMHELPDSPSRYERNLSSPSGSTVHSTTTESVSGQHDLPLLAGVQLESPNRGFRCCCALPIDRHLPPNGDSRNGWSKRFVWRSCFQPNRGMLVSDCKGAECPRRRENSGVLQSPLRLCQCLPGRRRCGSDNCPTGG